MIKQLSETLSPFRYVVQRNWDLFIENKLVPGHDDIDILVSDEDAKKVKELTKDFPIKVDVRAVGDLYYPKVLAQDMLEYRVLHESGMYIPGRIEAFHALFYHNFLHKKGNPYGQKLVKMFFEIYKPVHCLDSGVKNYDPISS